MTSEFTFSQHLKSFGQLLNELIDWRGLTYGLINLIDDHFIGGNKILTMTMTSHFLPFSLSRPFARSKTSEKLFSEIRRREREREEKKLKQILTQLSLYNPLTFSTPFQCDQIGRFFPFGQLFKACGSNYFAQIAHIFRQFFCKDVKIFHFSSEIIFWQILWTFVNFLLVTLLLSLLPSPSLSLSFFEETSFH